MVAKGKKEEGGREEGKGKEKGTVRRVVIVNRDGQERRRWMEKAVFRW